MKFPCTSYSIGREPILRFVYSFSPSPVLPDRSINELPPSGRAGVNEDLFNRHSCEFLHQLFVLSSMSPGLERKPKWCRSKSWGKDLLWYISCYYIYYLSRKTYFFKNFIILTYFNSHVYTILFIIELYIGVYYLLESS